MSNLLKDIWVCADCEARARDYTFYLPTGEFMTVDPGLTAVPSRRDSKHLLECDHCGTMTHRTYAAVIVSVEKEAPNETSVQAMGRMFRRAIDLSVNMRDAVRQSLWGMDIDSLKRRVTDLEEKANKP